MADLRKIGLKWGNDISENLAPKFHSKVKATSPTPLPPSPRKVRFWHTFFVFLPYRLWTVPYLLNKNLGRTLYKAEKIPYACLYMWNPNFKNLQGFFYQIIRGATQLFTRPHSIGCENNRHRNIIIWVNDP